MKTTKTSINIELAQEFIQVRKDIKELQAREKALKLYFSDLIDDGDNLEVGTAIIISKTMGHTSTIDRKAMFRDGINVGKYTKTTYYPKLLPKFKKGERCA
jgi:hypothetical protein